MVYDSIVFRQNITSFLRKCLILLVLVLMVSFVVLFDMKPAFCLAKFDKQYNSPKQIQPRPQPVFIYRDFENDTSPCPYYGPKHGLFHPSVEHPRFIITGGAGFIGSHLVKRLREQNYKARQIKVFDNLSQGRLANLQFENGTWAINTYLDYCLIDLRNKDNALKFLTGADILFHLADISPENNQSSVIHDNILLNTNTLHAAKMNKISNFIYVGTICNLPLDIDSLKEGEIYSIQSKSSYCWSKLMGEYEIELSKSDDFNIGLIRLHHVYGPSSSINNRIISSLIQKALHHKMNESFIVQGSGEQYYDLIYIDDVIDGLLLTMNKGMNKGVIELGSGKATTIKQIVDVINQKLPRKLNISFNNRQEDKEPIANIDRAKGILKWQAKVNINDGVLKTMAWMKKTRKQNRILVINIGQIRGGELAWKSLYKHLIQPFNAHLALYISNWQLPTFLHNITQYIWTINEYKDWGQVYKMVEKSCTTGNITDKWRNYCELPGIFMGGVENCRHNGSAAILLSYRWLLQQKMLELNLFDKYDWFILTRSDELYLCDHYNFLNMNPNHLLLPVGEYYGGFSDRHIIGKMPLFMEMLNTTTELICKPDYWFQTFKQLGLDYNLETLQKVFWQQKNISVSEFQRSMFTVRKPHDPTKWSQGHNHSIFDKFDLKLKYPDEFTLTMQYCNVSNVKTTLKRIGQYVWHF